MIDLSIEELSAIVYKTQALKALGQGPPPSRKSAALLGLPTSHQPAATSPGGQALLSLRQSQAGPPPRRRRR
jgi:hypothetical protein